MKTEEIWHYSRAEEIDHRARVEWGTMTDAERAEFERDRSGIESKQQENDL